MLIYNEMLIYNVKFYPLSHITDCIGSNIKVSESIFRMDTRCTNGRLMRTIPSNFQATSLALCVTTPIDKRSTTRIKSWTFLRQQKSPTLPSRVARHSFPHLLFQRLFPQVPFQRFEDTHCLRKHKEIFHRKDKGVAFFIKLTYYVMIC